MSLTTPEKTRTLQRKLYRKAKEKKKKKKKKKPPRRGRLRPELFSVCLTMKLVGKPDAGNRHVRFDERGQETECCHMAQATAPVLDSTPLTGATDARCHPHWHKSAHNAPCFYWLSLALSHSIRMRRL